MNCDDAVVESIIKIFSSEERKKSLHKVIDHENLCQCVDQNVVFLIRLREKFFTLLMQNRNFMISIFSTDVCGKYDQLSLGKLAYQAEHANFKIHFNVHDRSNSFFKERGDLYRFFCPPLRIS